MTHRKTALKTTCKEVEKRPGALQTAIEVLGDKWNPLLIANLLGNSQTFSQLENTLSGISPRTLSDRLDYLEKKGVIGKSIYNSHPPRHRYTLTEDGKGLRQALTAMATWGSKNS